MPRFDAPRRDEMESFLQKMNKLAMQNDSEYLDNKIIYGELSKYGLKTNDLQLNRDYKKITPLFDEWIKRYRRSKKIHVFKANRPFLEFMSYDEMPSNEFIKLYIPIDNEHIYKSAILIFDYMEKLGIPHQSKIAELIRSDNIVIRVDKSQEQKAQQIIDFISSNPYIVEGLNKTNPFIPTVNGIGYMRDNGRSYNSDLSIIIRDFLYFNKKQGITNFDMNRFNEFFRNRCVNPEYREAYEKALGNVLSIPANKTSIDVNNNPQTIRHEIMNDFMKNKIILEALRETYDKYGIEQVIYAIEEVYESNSFKGITNKTNNYRDKLTKNVGINYFKSYIKKTMLANGFIDDSPSYNAKVITQLLFSNSLALNIDKISNATYEKYGKRQLEYAIHEYIKNGTITNFSRFASDDREEKENLRELLSGIDKESFIKGIINNIKLKGIPIETTEINEIVSIYVNIMEREHGITR